MTWHHYRSSIPLPCGSCRRQLRGTPEAPAVFARVSVGRLIRCQPCAERLRDWNEERRGVCAWPRVMDFGDAGYRPPAPTLPGTLDTRAKKPYHPLAAQVRAYRSTWSEVEGV